MNITAEVTVHEIDGETLPVNREVSITLKSHWNDSGGRFVILEVDGVEYTVTSKNLSAGISAVTTR